MFNKKLIIIAILVSGSAHYAKAAQPNLQDLQAEAAKETVALINSHVEIFEARIQKSLAQQGIILPESPTIQQILGKFLAKMKPSDVLEIIERDAKIKNIEQIGNLMLQEAVNVNANGPKRLTKLMVQPILVLISSREFEEFYIQMKTKAVSKL